MPSQLFFVNVPFDCSDRELKDWIESRGIETESIRIIRDLVAGVSPAFAYADLKDPTLLAEAVARLNGKSLRENTVTVQPVVVRPAGASTPERRQRS